MDSASGSFTPSGLALSDPFEMVQSSHGPVGMQSAMNTGATCTLGSGSSGGTGNASVLSVGPQVSVGSPSSICQSAGGTMICDTQSAAGANCGSYNGDQVCVQSVAPGTCASFRGGAAVCQQAAGTSAVQSPPAPNNGTAGQPAAPDETVTSSAGTVNYYSSATVARSSAATTTTGAAGSGTNTGVVPGAVAGTGSGTANTTTAPCPQGQTCGGTDAFADTGCVTPPSCSDTDPVQCGIVNEEWLFRCEAAADSDVANAIGTVTGPVNTTVDVSNVLSENGNASVNAVSVPAGAAVTIMGQNLSLDIFSKFCTFASDMSVIIMALAYMAAARIMFQGAVSNR